jgi:hypothetical protein
MSQQPRSKRTDSVPPKPAPLHRIRTDGSLVSRISFGFSGFIGRLSLTGLTLTARTFSV